VRILTGMVALMTAGQIAAAEPLPLPRPRPVPVVRPAAVPAPETELSPSACRLRLTELLAVAPSLPPLVGPGECGAPDVVRLEAVVLPDASRIAIKPPAILRCEMAEAVVQWVREEAVPQARALGAALRDIENYDSFDCRGRNRIPGAQLSEHGKANALDIRSLRLEGGRVVHPTDPEVDKEFRSGLRRSVCGRFATVLGPGSDGYHEDHIHIDLAARRGGYRMCQWELREPDQATLPAGAAASGAATGSAFVPLPRERPEPPPGRP
jgi:hypothetical protein